jgi:hypothetical protein
VTPATIIRLDRDNAAEAGADRGAGRGHAGLGWCRLQQALRAGGRAQNLA